MTIDLSRVRFPRADEPIRARPAGFVHDLTSIAGRALRAVPRDLTVVIPPVFISLFFFVVNVATLKRVVAQVPGLNYTAFQMGTAILLGVTGVSRAPALVLDIQNHYFDRLLLTPVRRTAILLGHMVADMAVSAALTVPILALGLGLGVHFEGGPLGVVIFIVVASLELGLCRIWLCDRLEDGESGRGEFDLPTTSSRSCSSRPPTCREANSRAGSTRWQGSTP